MFRSARGDNSLACHKLCNSQTNHLCLHHARDSSPALLNWTGYKLPPRFITTPSNTSARAARLIDRSDSLSRSAAPSVSAIEGVSSRELAGIVGSEILSKVVFLSFRRCNF